MRKLGWIAALPGLLAACGIDGAGGGAPNAGLAVGVSAAATTGVSGGGNPGGSPASPPAPSTVLSLDVTNFDGLDYALWIQAQDGQGLVNEELVALLPAAPAGSFTEVIQDVSVNPGLSYTLLLRDPSGFLWDALALGFPGSGLLIPVSLSVEGAILQAG